MAVFGVWMLLEPAGHTSPTVMAEGLAQLPAGLIIVWVGFRVLGSVLIVPIAEDLRPDGIRSPDPGFQYAVEERLTHEVAERGLSVLRLDAAARPDWLDAVERTAWERLRPAQLPLPSL